MARDGTGAAFILPLLMKLTAADWSHARTLAPQLDDALRRACKIHRAQPVFEAEGQPTPLVLARLPGLSSQDLLVIASAFADASERVGHPVMVDKADPDGGGSSGSARKRDVSPGPELARLMAQSTALTRKGRPGQPGPRVRGPGARAR